MRSPSGDAVLAPPTSPTTSRDGSGDVAATLGLAGTAKSRKQRLHRALAGALLLAAIAVALFFWFRRAPAAPTYETVAARRGDLTVTVTATGALAPLDTVYVGTEVSGIVDVVAADYNDHVTKGQVIAVLNTDQLQAQIRQARAALAAAQANAQQMAATLAEAEPQAVRAESLFKRTMISPEALESARAALARARASEANARAQAAGAEAALQAQETMLNKATIRAPISGIVLQRAVERGRTVAAALQAPTLFVLAADLEHMTLSLDVDEADIGQVAVGQMADFTVDAYPDTAFSATVRSVRNAAKTVEGVVTYQAILDVSNPRLLLRPGMTATARIATASAHDVLLVPNAALRFTPASDTAASAVAAIEPGNAMITTPPSRARKVWTVRAGKPIAIPLTVGLTDGQWTEVIGGALTPGTRLIVGAAETGTTPASTTSSSSSTRSTSSPPAGGHPPGVPMGRPRG
ncbi:MAG TPA: efflux RND transporter periplasmic adaptor subunit [Gemmatimonadaceae bacterium]